MGALVVPHERQQCIGMNNSNFLVYEMPTTWYQSAEGTAKSKLPLWDRLREEETVVQDLAGRDFAYADLGGV